MPYPRRLLHDEETVAVDLHPHWSYFSRPVVFLVAAIVLGVVTLVVTDGGSTTRTALGWVSLVALVATVIWVVLTYLRWATTHFVITSDRIVHRSGILAKSGVEIPLERVNTVHFRQSVLERMTGSGDLVIESGGEDGQQRFTDIRDPGRIQREIHQQMDRNGRRRSTAGAGPNADVATQLEKFEAMFERGTLSQEEFDAQKARLLGGG